MNPTIIEKAAEALWGHVEHKTRNMECDGADPMEIRRSEVTAVLAAVYADIQAEALREAAASYQRGGWALAMPAGSDRPALILGMAQRAIDWLRVRADEMDGGKP